MPELYEQNALWVDDADDMFADDNIERDPLEEIVVSEEDAKDEIDSMLTPIVVDELEHDPFSEPYYVEGPTDEERLEMEKSKELDSPVIVEEMVPGADIVLKDDAPEDAAEDKTPKDWMNDKEHSQFVSYVLDKKNKIPKHSGETIPGCERAKSFLKSLDNEISQAMRSDLDGVIDEQQIDAVRKEIENMTDRLDRQINKLKKKTKKADITVRLVSEGQCEKCKSIAPMWHDVINNKAVCMHCESEITDDAEKIEKTASTPIINVYVTAFERAIVGTMVNSAVSSGRDIEETYERLKNKYNFTPREELAIQQLVSDYGYPVYKDRGLLNEPADPSSGDGVDWQTNYHA